MAIEYNKTIFMGMPVPSDKCLLVTIPMDMYRIQTNGFVQGLNFFQKAVLKLKFMPQISNATIAKLLNLEEHLVNIIVDELEEKDLLTSSGYLTPKGNEARRNSSGLIIDESKKKIGYVFSYNDGKELFPCYQSEVCFAEITGDKLVYTTDKVRTTNAPLSVFTHYTPRTVAPTESEILQLIKCSTHQHLDVGDVDESEKGLFQIKLVPNDHPETVNICTYIYLPKNEEDNTYSDEWQVMDPFDNRNSYELKAFLNIEEMKNRELANAIFSTFKDAETESNRKYNESVLWFERKVDERIVLIFGEENFSKLSINVKQSVQNVIKAYMRMELDDFKKIAYDQTQIFFLNMQASIETILKQDQLEREETYMDLDINYGEYGTQEERKKCLRAVYRKKIISDTTIPPRVLLNSKTKSWKGKSLLDCLLKFIMTISVEPNYNDCPIYGIFKNRVESIINIAEKRNPVSHGNVGEDNFSGGFSKENIDHYFSFFCELLTDYINIL